MAYTKNDEAVSPVIGVILMVTITVILAAVIAAFVFGMAGNISKTKVVAATASQKGNLITVTYNGGQDAGQVTALNAYLNGGSFTTDFAGTTVGSTAENAGTAGTNDHVTVTATFDDGSSQVILDTYV
jgi:flagellin-like protein